MSIIPFTHLFKLFLKSIIFPFLIFWKTLVSIIDYLDSKHRIKDDWYIIPYFFKSILNYMIMLRTNRFHYWYLFEKQVKKNGSRLAISYPKPLLNKNEFEVQLFTYTDMYKIVLRLTYDLYYTYNVKSGDFIGIDFTNKPLFIFLWFALWNIGAIPVFLNYNILGQPLIHSINISHITQIFIDLQASENIKKSEGELLKTIPDIQLHYLDEEQFMSKYMDSSSPELRIKNTERSPSTLKDFMPAMLIFTSGTTGLPKSAIMSWKKAVIGCTLFGHILRIKNKSTVFTAMPLYHSTAALLGVCATFSQGGCTALSNKFSTSAFWKQVYLTNSTHIQYVGEVCRYLLNSPISKYENIHSVQIAYGNGLRPDIWKEFKQRFHIDIIGEFYASTESPLATTSFQRGDFGIGACRNYGTIINWFLSIQQTLVKLDPNNDNMIYRNKNKFCEVAPVNEPGELLMRIFMPKSPETSFQGYLGNKKETESKILRDVFKKGDAWYRSGDLLKSDKHGLWYFVDRMGDTFRWKSENVSATEVENQILSHNIKNIFSQVVVVGIKIPNHEGRAGFGVIELTPKFQNMGISENIRLLNDLLSHLNGELPKYALPLFIKFVDQIYTIDNHKISKKNYRDQVMPRGKNNDEYIYWLDGYKKYKLLTDADWKGIINGEAKL